MTKLAANLTMLFNEVPFMERFAAAAHAGFKGVEFLFPYAYPAADIAAQLDAHQLRLVLHNLPAGAWERGERGIACHPDRVDEFRRGVADAIVYAKALGVTQLNCLAGILPPGVSAERAQQTLVANLTYAAGTLKQAGIRLLIEPINTFDIPGFFLSGTAQALELIAATGSDNLFVQYDIYHMQRMEGELANTIKANLPLIGHVQLADNPGRGEPGSGEINYRYLFELLDTLGYEGWIGCEYKPRGATLAGLDWRAAHGL
ncbi:hydroxypyruvate isomerase [Janthinobacterium sp.]|uniref:hydroxypyruvate isomerase n=1 Tax=Janthinobacterium sp. TaxID=1871054 RepID=UPI00293D5D50|nr:hydroxypyruvate isomerase [Janthinobacterium sp.]